MAAGPSIRFAAVTARMLGGLLIWTAHFGVIYILNTLACARGFSGPGWLGLGTVTWGIGIATLLALLGAGGLAGAALRRIRRREPREDANDHFVDWMTAAVGAAALVGILWDALPVLIVPACA